jgi:hypothetical protein
MSYLIGAILALTVGLFATRVGFDRDRAFYSTVMLVVASYYVLFAVAGGSSEALLIECLVFVPFLIAATAGFKRSQWLVVAGLAAHGALDLVHPHLVSNPGVPDWWPGFCLAYDGVAACYLGILLLGPRAKRWWYPRPSGNEGTRTHPVLGGSELVGPPGGSR